MSKKRSKANRKKQIKAKTILNSKNRKQRHDSVMQSEAMIIETSPHGVIFGYGNAEYKNKKGCFLKLLSGADERTIFFDRMEEYNQWKEALNSVDPSNAAWMFEGHSNGEIGKWNFVWAKQDSEVEFLGFQHIETKDIRKSFLAA